MIDNKLLKWINNWILEEKSKLLLGVLSTCFENNPYSRTIAIKEIKESGVLFFTQKCSKKVQHISRNSNVSLTILLPSKLRQITLRGEVMPLSDADNNKYWNIYAKDSQIRFLVYGSQSGEIINDNTQLDKDLKEKQIKLANLKIDKPDSYVGYLIKPKYIDFYQLNNDQISDSFIAKLENNKWVLSRQVP